MTIEKYINDDGLVGVVFPLYGDIRDEEPMFDKELVKNVIDKDFEAYRKRSKKNIWVNDLKDEFNDLTVEFLKPGTKFFVISTLEEENRIITDEDLIEA